jgi:hypothetical protein
VKNIIVVIGALALVACAGQQQQSDYHPGKGGAYIKNGTYFHDRNEAYTGETYMAEKAREEKSRRNAGPGISYNGGTTDIHGRPAVDHYPYGQPGAYPGNVTGSVVPLGQDIPASAPASTPVPPPDNSIMDAYNRAQQMIDSQNIQDIHDAIN